MWMLGFMKIKSVPQTLAILGNIRENMKTFITKNVWRSKLWICRKLYSLLSWKSTKHLTSQVDNLFPAHKSNPNQSYDADDLDDRNELPDVSMQTFHQLLRIDEISYRSWWLELTYTLFYLFLHRYWPENSIPLFYMKNYGNYGGNYSGLDYRPSHKKFPFNALLSHMSHVVWSKQYLT